MVVIWQYHVYIIIFKENKENIQMVWMIVSMIIIITHADTNPS